MSNNPIFIVYVSQPPSYRQDTFVASLAARGFTPFIDSKNRPTRETLYNLCGLVYYNSCQTVSTSNDVQIDVEDIMCIQYYKQKISNNELELVRTYFENGGYLRSTRASDQLASTGVFSPTVAQLARVLPAQPRTTDPLVVLRRFEDIKLVPL